MPSYYVYKDYLRFLYIITFILIEVIKCLLELKLHQIVLENLFKLLRVLELIIKVKQKIVKHIGVALDEYELNELKLLASAIKTKLELENTLHFIPLKRLRNKLKIEYKRYIYNDDYVVNIKDLVEEDRVITGIHDIYGKMFDELDLKIYL